MNRRFFSSLASIIVVAILIVIGISTKINSAKDDTFSTQKLNANSNAYKKINDKVISSIKENGVFLLQTDEANVTYLILNGSHLNTENKIPYFSDIKIENKEDSIIIHFSEELKPYSTDKNAENRLIYKIAKGKDYEYIKLFRNGEGTHFNTIIGG